MTPSKLTNSEKKQLERLYAATIQPYFKAIELLHTRETHAPRIALAYVVWEHLAWLWCPASKRKLKDPGTAFRQFTADFMSDQPSFESMVAHTNLTLDCLWAERNKQLHSGRMVPDVHEKNEPEFRNIFYCDFTSAYRGLFDQLLLTKKGQQQRAGVIYMDVLVASLRSAGDGLKARLLSDGIRGGIALTRLRLKGAVRVGDLVLRRSAVKFQRLRHLLSEHKAPDLYPMPNGNLRLAFCTGEAIELNPIELTEFASQVNSTWPEESKAPRRG